MSWLTEDLPGTGGHYKEQPEDFQVEEIPLYPCSGKGEHLYLWIEKEGISTHELLNQLKQGLRINEREIGYAGLKDARARTRQMISVPISAVDRVSGLQLRGARILLSQLHGNKLRLGHLAGNRFTIRLRNCVQNAEQRATVILQRLERQGVPNRFGEQRYGILGNSAVLGRLLLQHQYADFCRELIGDPQRIHNSDWQAAAEAYRQEDFLKCLQRLPQRMRDERRLIRTLVDGRGYQQAALSLPRNLLRLYLSAYQSQLFDQLLEQRLPNLYQLYDGDIAYKHDNGACFRVDSACEEQPRADRFEISPTAALFGFKALRATGQPGALEEACLTEAKLTFDSWRLEKGLSMQGERRPLRVPLFQPAAKADTQTDIILSFSMPKGSYATSVLLELIK